MRAIARGVSVASFHIGALLLVFVACVGCIGRGESHIDLHDYEPRLLEEPLATARDQTRIARYGSYSVAYHLGWRQPQWVAYRLGSEQLKERVGRKGYSFQKDPVLKDCTLTNQDFKGAIYSRGHLKPAADSRSNKRAMRESFYFTNVSPQSPAFNSGIWNALEMWVRGAAKTTDMLYVVTGPCFLASPLDSMGQKKVPVATHFYKALLKRDGNAWNAIGFIVPHDLNRKARPREFAVPVDSLEKLTRIDFFPLLPDSIENVVEAAINQDAWW